ncbi:hypothetical protein SAGO17_0028 [Mimivirus AB-566-O17]|uniref:Uncharacterized protein n=1 Tax=Mimivirus AB-566-O17 TaxID=1988039 RepID=A0A1X9VNQ6_9VIRU|nr:hypothetical protein SAGO17_0028 [Mimivirus AB-566-O17]
MNPNMNRNMNHNVLIQRDMFDIYWQMAISNGFYHDKKPILMSVKLYKKYAYSSDALIKRQHILATIIQNVYKSHYTIRKVAATKITNACHNWVWKPYCNDFSIGIRPRLDMIALGINP